jgi:hypothetical protein
MRLATIFMMLIAIASNSFCQQTSTISPLTKTDYLAKSKRQKTAAWILLSGGFACSVIGSVIVSNDVENEFGSILVTGHNTNTSTAGAILFVTGTASMIGSIPLFIAAHRNKKMGMSLSFRKETAPLIQKNRFVYTSVPSLTLKISL